MAERLLKNQLLLSPIIPTQDPFQQHFITGFLVYTFLKIVLFNSWLVYCKTSSCFMALFVWDGEKDEPELPGTDATRHLESFLIAYMLTEGTGLAMASLLGSHVKNMSPRDIKDL